MTIRLTDAQMTVLRALDKLPEGKWITAKEGGFSGYAAPWLAYPNPHKGMKKALVERKGISTYRLRQAGRDLIATLKAEGRW